jgi:hypothetical protein
MSITLDRQLSFGLIFLALMVLGHSQNTVAAADAFIPNSIVPALSDAYNRRAIDVPVRTTDKSNYSPPAGLDLSPLSTVVPLAGPEQGDALAVLSQEASVRSQADAFRRQNTGFVDAFRASYDNEVRPLMNSIARIYETPITEPLVDRDFRAQMYRDWEKRFKGYNENERKNLMESYNEKDFARRVEQIKMQRDNAQVLDDAGQFYRTTSVLLATATNPVNLAVVGLCAAIVLPLRSRKVSKSDYSVKPAPAAPAAEETKA